MGFDSGAAYNRMRSGPDLEPPIGEYEFAVRVFSEGFGSRVLVGGHGVVLTTDDVDTDAFEDMAVAVRRLLAAR